MKNLLLVVLQLLMLTVWGCRNDEPTEPAKLYLLESDSIALCHISESFKTDATGYPHPWTVSDRASWKGSIELDTVIDEESGKALLTVGALRLYIPEPADPMNSWLCQLRNVRDFKIYACPGANFVPDFLPIGCDSLLIDKINPDAPGYINVPYRRWDTANTMDKYRWAFSKIEIHGLDINYFNISLYFDAIIDLSNNTFDKDVDLVFSRFINKPNLSHNKYTGLSGGWNFWMFDDLNIPNLQYNEIPIPEEIIDTDFWRKNHELFIGNPGYQAPK